MRETLYSIQKENWIPKKKKFLWEDIIVAVVALAMMIMFSVNYYLQSPDLVVYAATGDKMVQLRLNERVNLETKNSIGIWVCSKWVWKKEADIIR